MDDIPRPMRTNRGVFPDMTWDNWEFDSGLDGPELPDFPQLDVSEDAPDVTRAAGPIRGDGQGTSTPFSSLKGSNPMGTTSPPGTVASLRREDDRHQQFASELPRPRGGRTFNVPRRSYSVWGILFIGIVVLTCGSLLALGSQLGGRGELWRIGGAIAICGQLLIVLGLILQIEWVSELSHGSAETLRSLDGLMHRVYQTASSLRNQVQRFDLHAEEDFSGGTKLASPPDVRHLMKSLDQRLERLGGQILRFDRPMKVDDADIRP